MKSLLIVDKKKLKVVYGDKIRCISFSDLSLEHNSEFLDMVFRDTQVHKIEKVSPVSKEILGSLLSTVATSKADDPVEVNDPVEVSDVPIAPKQKPSLPKPDSVSSWVKSNAPTILVIDDVYTGVVTRRGAVEVKQTLSFEIGKPVDVSTLDQESVRNSNIMKRLVGNGTLSRISYDEAMQMLEEYNKREVLSVHDEGAKGVLSSSGKSAKELSATMFSGEGGDLVAEPLMVTGEGKEGASMADLMAQIDSDEDLGMLEGNGQAEFTGLKQI